MKLTWVTTPAMILTAMAVAASPAAAQHRDHNNGRSEGQAVSRDRGEGRRVEGQQHAAPPPPQQQQQPQQQRQSVPNEAARRAVPPRVESRAAEAPQVRRQEGYAVPRRDAGRPVVVSPRVERPVVVAPRYSAPVYSAPRYAAPRVYAPTPRYYYYGYRPGYRPYVFRPFSRFSFGLIIGSPLPYAYRYAYPVPVYGYGAPSAPVYITPSSTLYGGISLEITPSDAQVFIDGEYVGLVGDFDGITAPLNLVAGRHHVEISAQGYAPLAFDIDVVPGQLIPYRGDMQPYRY
jgi:PEGA domain